MSKGGPGIGSLLRRTLQTVLRGAPVAIAEPPPVTPGELKMEELRALLGRTDPVILEIGCNDGMHTQRFLDTFAGARVYGFEPDERARRRFQAAILDPRAQLFATAVGAIDGVTTFYPSTGAPDAEWAAKLPEGWDISGSIRVPKEHREVHPWCHFGPGMDVAVTRLDTWAKTHAQGQIDFIWADVQGAEGDLIAGGRKTLAKTRYFYTEYSNRELYEGQLNLAAILGLLPDFEVIRRYKGDVLLRNKRLTTA